MAGAGVSVIRGIFLSPREAKPINWEGLASRGAGADLVWQAIGECPHPVPGDGLSAVVVGVTCHFSKIEEPRAVFRLNDNGTPTLLDLKTGLKATSQRYLPEVSDEAIAWRIEKWDIQAIVRPGDISTFMVFFRT